MALSINVKDDVAEKIVEDAKIKAIRTKISLSEAVIRLLDKWVHDEVDLNGGNQ